MTLAASGLVLIGEVYIDVTLAQPGQETKLRFGGLVHAARGLWAAEIAYEVGAFAPAYVSDSLPLFLSEHGCATYRLLGTVHGAPNVILIGDPAEVGYQGYQTLLREEKRINVDDDDFSWTAGKDVLIFPGIYDWQTVVKRLPEDCRLHIDFAYDVGAIAELEDTGRTFRTIFISTSSVLFDAMRPCSRSKLVAALADVDYHQLIIKENRGGSALYDKATDTFANVPAKLADETVNSVGVGDLYDAIYVARSFEGRETAAKRASLGAAAYAQTTYPDVLKKLITRALRADPARLAEGVVLPWDDRPDRPIYLAGPDFDGYAGREFIELAAKALTYHNFKVIRPVLENGELQRPASVPAMRRTYKLDKQLLEQSAALVAVPLDRDPGTLVEVGLALQAGIPVIVFDPFNHAENTMVVGSAAGYATDFGVCLNALFRILSKQ